MHSSFVRHYCMTAWTASLSWGGVGEKSPSTGGRPLLSPSGMFLIPVEGRWTSLWPHTRTLGFDKSHLMRMSSPATGKMKPLVLAMKCSFHVTTRGHPSLLSSYYDQALGRASTMSVIFSWLEMKTDSARVGPSLLKESYCCIIGWLLLVEARRRDNLSLEDVLLYIKWTFHKECQSSFHKWLWKL